MTIKSILMVLFSGGIALGQPGNIKDCEVALAKDYFTYSQRDHLQEDFLKYIDEQAYRKIKEDLDTSGDAYGGLFSGDTNYHRFDEQRNQRLQNEHYQRTRDQAVDILRISSSDRAYESYDRCVDNIGLPRNSPGRTLIWASRETPDEIYLHVKYMNTPGVASIDLDGTVQGGERDGAPPGLIWSGKEKRWGINQEKSFTIKEEAWNF